jgi:hypothetical protein
MGFHEVPWNSMRFYDVLVNRSVPTEANRGLTSYINIGENQIVYNGELEGLALAFEYAAKVAMID